MVSFSGCGFWLCVRPHGGGDGGDGGDDATRPIPRLDYCSRMYLPLNAWSYNFLVSFLSKKYQVL